MRILPAIFILSFNLTFAQERQLTNDSDTAFWFNWRTELNAELGLPTIDKSIEQFEFRFWDNKKDRPLIEDYKNWLKSEELTAELRNNHEYSYHIDQLLFALGKSIKLTDKKTRGNSR